MTRTSRQAEKPVVIRFQRIAPWTALVVALGCAPATAADLLFEESASDSDERADRTGQLNIRATNERMVMRTALSAPQVGSLSRSSTARINLDGSGFSSKTHVVLDGTLYRWDGGTESHRMVVKPTFIGPESGTANPGGFLRVDFKDVNSFRRFSDPTIALLGTVPGVFRGVLVASDAVSLADATMPDLSKLRLPALTNGKPVYGAPSANVLEGFELTIQPNVILTRFAPKNVNCYRATQSVLSTTAARTLLDVWVTLDGFPVGERNVVKTEITYRTPGFGDGLLALSPGVIHLASFRADPDRVDYAENSQPMLPRNESGQVDLSRGAMTIGLPEFDTRPRIGRDPSEYVDLEVRATLVGDSQQVVSARTSHRLLVGTKGSRILVDAYDLCTPSDEQCHAERDRGVADNLVARRRIQEHFAAQNGSFDRIELPATDCLGGDAVAGSGNTACRRLEVTRSSSLRLKAEATAQAEISIGGEWTADSGAIATLLRRVGLTIPDLEGSARARLHADFSIGATASFERVFSSYSQEVTQFNPSTASVQFWRIITPRVSVMHYTEIAECGEVQPPIVVQIRDLSRSRTVRVCAPLRFDQTCTNIRPTDASYNACNTLLYRENSTVCAGTVDRISPQPTDGKPTKVAPPTPIRPVDPEPKEGDEPAAPPVQP